MLAVRRWFRRYFRALDAARKTRQQYFDRRRDEEEWWAVVEATAHCSGSSLVRDPDRFPYQVFPTDFAVYARKWSSKSEALDDAQIAAAAADEILPDVFFEIRWIVFAKRPNYAWDRIMLGMSGWLADIIYAVMKNGRRHYWELSRSKKIARQEND